MTEPTIEVCSYCKGKGRISPLPKMEGMPRYEVCVTCYGTGKVGGEPTIDAIVAWLNEIEFYRPIVETQYFKAIRAILEQHRANQGDIVVNTGSKESPHYERVVPKSELPPHWELDPIRAFVERVEKKIQERGEWRSARIWDAIEQELAAMEKANAGTSD